MAADARNGRSRAGAGASTQAAPGGPTSAADALQELLAGPLGAGMAPAARVARAWYAANGDRERRHTTGVWLRKPGRAGADPVLVVALDSNLMASELGTNKELYLSRLAFHGVAVSDIRFTVRRRDASVPAAARAHARRTDPPPLPDLAPADAERVRRATEGLPDGLRQSVERAMSATLRRSRGT